MAETTGVPSLRSVIDAKRDRIVAIKAEVLALKVELKDARKYLAQILKRQYVRRHSASVGQQQ